MVVQSPPVTVTTPTEAHRAELLGRRAFAAIALGNWPQAFEAAEECRALADPIGQPHVLAEGEAAAGIVAAVRGDAPAACDLLQRSGRAASTRGMTGLLDVVQLGRGIAALSAGRYDEAWAQLRQVVGSGTESPAWVSLVAVGFLAEAGLHSGRGLAERTVSAALDELAPPGSAPALRGATAYARAVSEITGIGGEVDTTFDRALAECPPDRAFDRARINLARGVCLRRERRVAESRLPLHEALGAFERLGAIAWAEQARGELRASGARGFHRELGEADALTAQELQIVRLAAQGMTNREIGQRLYLSHRTIGSHLYRAFPKLGIAARAQLRDVLADFADRDGAPELVAG
jgi:DNA-binding CsgD family transcriptional regulator